ncbi:MAG: hypothetical protein K2Y26_05030 [Gemmatimonadaceae bacterium]|uniref:hypothetical protein n=1 Tax=Gemmatimonas sp. UBA7669 TaxID=1946568 RepID=UPI0025B98FCA|nr:hypothetical protein [Gemmatimonas sp. UBA7669]MBX9854863.1 hypothetical protein [Gemmatimonadaceae bacterium]
MTPALPSTPPTSTLATLWQRVLAVAGATLVAACSPERATAPGVVSASAALGVTSASAEDHALASIRAATARYHRADVAIAAGYLNTGECVASPSGGMGIHFVNPAFMGSPAPNGDAVFDPARPEVLIYEPTKNGQLQLVAIEYLVWRAPWDAAHPTASPSFLGHTFAKSFAEAAHGLPDHYELHVWLWKHNANGMFADWNPKVSCPAVATIHR